MMIFSPLFILKDLQLRAFRKYSYALSGRMLDAGCGGSPYKSCLKNTVKFIGLDPVLGVHPEVAASTDNLPFKDESFDSMLCTEVLEHIPEPQKAIEGMRRVLKKGGFLYISVPQSWCLHYEPDDYFRFTKYGISYLLERGGFEVIALEKIGGLFSLIGVRLSDSLWQKIADILKPVCGMRPAEALASILVLPVSLSFYFLAKLGDGIDAREAICWGVLARK